MEIDLTLGLEVIMEFALGNCSTCACVLRNDKRLWNMDASMQARMSKLGIPAEHK